MRELLARIRACLRLPGGPPVSLGSMVFDVETRSVSIGGNVTVMRRSELAILETLMQRVGEVVLRDHVERNVYGADDEVQPNALDAHVSRLRRRLSAGQAGVAIHAIRGVGLMISEA